VLDRESVFAATEIFTERLQVEPPAAPVGD
jgi:hypothetical protein